MIPKRLLRLAARTLVGALLFSQAAVALAACDWLRRAPAHAIAQAEQPAAEARCHEQERNVNLCVAHCLGEDQSLDKPAASIPAFDAAPVLILSVIAPAPHFAARAAEFVPPAAGPPPRIRFQTFRL
jgi:hypothetical protein